MARKPFWRRKPKKAEKRISDNWDLKGSTLSDIIAANGGGVITPEDAMKNPAVLAAVSLRSRLLASFPKAIFEYKDGGRIEVAKHPLYNILAHRPNSYMNAFTFWELLNTHLDLWGNAYAYISKYSKQVTALTPLHPNNVKVLVADGRVVYEVTGTKDRVLDKTHRSDRILHFKDISYDGIIGISRVSLANNAIAIAQSAEAFAKEFFDKGGHSKGVIETDQAMGDDAFQAFAKRWKANANFGTPVLDMGKKYKQLSIPMADSQYKEVREFVIQEIGRAFDVPAPLLNDHSRSSFNNISVIDQQTVKYGLRPTAKRYEAELELKLLGEDKLGKEIIRFNMDGMLRGDTASRAAYFAALKQNELYSTNEIRLMNGDNPSKDPKADKLENPNTTSNTPTNDEN